MTDDIRVCHRHPEDGGPVIFYIKEYYELSGFKGWRTVRGTYSHFPSESLRLYEEKRDKRKIPQNMTPEEAIAWEKEEVRSNSSRSARTAEESERLSPKTTFGDVV